LTERPAVDRHDARCPKHQPSTQEIDVKNLSAREFGSHSILRKIEGTFGAILFGASAIYYVGGMLAIVLQGTTVGA
jgi:hypothetical protein